MYARVVVNVNRRSSFDGVRQTTHMNTQQVKEKLSIKGKALQVTLLAVIVLLQLYSMNVVSKNAEASEAKATANAEQVTELTNKLLETERELVESRETIAKLKGQLDELEAQLQALQPPQPAQQYMAAVPSGNGFEIECTAYEGGGHTATGQDLNYKTREDAMCIAVDPDVIPLGSLVQIIFDEPWSHLNGVYLASDTGGAVVGNIVDIYFGHDGYDEAMEFGRRAAYAEIIG